MEPNQSTYVTSEHLSVMLNKSRTQNQKLSFDYLSVIQESKISKKDRELLISKIFQMTASKSGSKKVENLAICFSDLFLSHKKLPSPGCLDLLAYVSVNLGLKYEESREMSLEEFELFTTLKFPESMINMTERFLIGIINWNLNLVTPVDFVDYFLIEYFGTNELNYLCKNVQRFLEVALKDYQISKQPAEIIALSCIVCARNSKNETGLEPWVKEACCQVGACEESLKGLSKDLRDLVNSLKN